MTLPVFYSNERTPDNFTPEKPLEDYTVWEFIGALRERFGDCNRFEIGRSAMGVLFQNAQGGLWTSIGSTGRNAGLDWSYKRDGVVLRSCVHLGF